MEDTEIITLYFSRSESAIAETAKKYGSYLNQVAYNILRSPEDTEEIVQDTYLAAWNVIPPQWPRAFRHFLSRITRNLSFDRLDYITAQCRNHNLSTVLSELEDCIPDRTNDPEARMEAKLLGEAINAFLAKQSASDCAIFLSRYYYSMTVAEISKRYSLTEGTVKYRLSSLRGKLRKHLQKEGIAV